MTDSASDWVEIVDPQTLRTFYANVVSGSCFWDRPADIQVRPRCPDGEWWELFDPTHNLPYYYNTKTAQTEWTRPTDGLPIISLIVLQKSAGAAGFPFGGAVASPVHPAAKASQPLNEKDQNVPVPNGPASNTASATVQLGGSNPELTNSGKALPAALLDDINKFKIEGFASKFFATHKRGIFRRKVPLQQMIHWSKDNIPSPLMRLRKELHKDSIKCFKIIQKIMGDKPKTDKPSAGNSEDIQSLLQMGIFVGELRDEIYCQLCKQLTKNPRMESTFAGWELMAVLVVTFPPSKNFEAYLNGFLKEGSQLTDGKLRTLAQHCILRLERISLKGPRGKVPTIAEIDRAKEAPFNPSVFGEALPDIMAAQKKQFPDLKLPRIMTFLAESILQLNGCSTEGIFRVPGDADAVTELRLRLEKGNYDVSGITDASVPASLFKFWLRDLTDPIIPHEMYDFCIKSAEDPVRAIAIVDKLPEYNKNVLQYLCNFLQIVGDPKNQPITRMSINNIAMVFAPNILRCPSDNLQVILEQTKFEQAFVRTLIQNLKLDVVGKLK